MKDTMHSEIKTRLNIANFKCKPERITELLGISPSFTWTKGENIPKTKLCYKENGWRIDSPLSGSDADLEKQIKSLLKILHPHKQGLKRLPSECEIELSCIISSYDGDRPAIYFDKKILQELTELDASIDIDLYVL